MLGPTLLTAAALVLLLWAEARGHTVLVRLAKPLASTGFVLAGLSAGGLESDYGRAVMGALALCWVGDVCLLSRRSAWFLAGLSAFLLGHGAFGAAFVLRGVDLGWVVGSAIPLSLVALGIRRWLAPYVPGDLRRPVDVYMLVITAMVALAVGATAAGATGLVAAGAFAFYLSDLSVARDRFVRRTLVNRLWGWPLYYGAQLLLAATIAR